MDPTGEGTWDEREDLTDGFGEMILEDTSLFPRRSSPATSPLNGRAEQYRGRYSESHSHNNSPWGGEVSDNLEMGRSARASAPGSPDGVPKGSGNGGIDDAGEGGGRGGGKGTGSLALQEHHSHGAESFSSHAQRESEQHKQRRQVSPVGGGGGNESRSDMNFNMISSPPLSNSRPGLVASASAGRLRRERSDASISSRRTTQVPYDPRRDPQEGFIGHPKHYGFGSTKRFWDPASGERESRSLFYFGTPVRGDGEGERSGGSRRRRPSSAAGERPSITEQTLLTPGGKLHRPLGANWQARDSARDGSWGKLGRRRVAVVENSVCSTYLYYL